MSKSNSEIEYPISPIVLIDYIKTTEVYPIFWSSNVIVFSTEPYMGKGSKHPVSVSVTYTETLDTKNLLSREKVEDILTRLNLRIEDFERCLALSK